MLNFKIFNATQARINLFKIFKMVSEGQEVVVIKEDSGAKFKISLFEEKPKKDFQRILQEMSEIGLKSESPEEIKKILITKNDPCLPNR